MTLSKISNHKAAKIINTMVVVDKTTNNNIRATNIKRRIITEKRTTITEEEVTIMVNKGIIKMVDTKVSTIKMADTKVSTIRMADTKASTNRETISRIGANNTSNMMKVKMLVNIMRMMTMMTDLEMKTSIMRNREIKIRANSSIIRLKEARNRSLMMILTPLMT